MNKRYVYIDFLRGLAALLVIYLHMALGIQENKLAVFGNELSIMDFFAHTIDVGKVGVTIFFAVSGFVIPFSLLKPGDRPVARFCVSRVFRLYPAYWLSILLMFLLSTFILNSPINVKAYIVNLTMLQQFVGVENVIGLFWTLQIELIFYAVCCCLFAADLLGSKRFVFLMATAFLIAAVGVAYGRHLTGRQFPVALPLALSIMFWGMLWRQYLLTSDLTSRKIVVTMLIFYACIIPLVATLGYDNEGAGVASRYTLTYYVALTCFVVFTKFVRISHPIAQWLGTISYSVYLFAFVGDYFAFDLLYPVFGGMVPGHTFIFASAVITIMFAAVTYNFVEKPSIELGHRLAGALAKGFQPPNRGFLRLVKDKREHHLQG
jgi:peptidoglycan/LPS O-acetylase OafA/YrhL